MKINIGQIKITDLEKCMTLVGQKDGKHRSYIIKLYKINNCDIINKFYLVAFYTNTDIKFKITVNEAYCKIHLDFWIRKEISECHFYNSKDFEIECLIQNDIARKYIELENNLKIQFNKIINKMYKIRDTGKEIFWDILLFHMADYDKHMKEFLK